MKKLMLSSMVLLPLILLVILTINTAAVSLTTHIYVENVALLHADDTIYLNKTDDEINPTYQLETTVYPTMASNKNITYSSLDTNIVTVDSNGLVKGIDYGSTYVKVESEENPDKVSTRKVVVTDSHVHKIIIDNKLTSLYVNDEYQLNCYVIPQEANNKTLKYQSSDTNVIDVTFSGLLLAKKSGTVDITIYSDDNPDVKQTIRVSAIQQLEDATIDGDLKDVILGSRQIKFPNILLNPKNADARILYSSSNTDIADVSIDGLITFKKAGIVTITANINKDQYVFSKKFQYMDGYISDINVVGEFTYDYDNLNPDKILNITPNIIPEEYDKTNLEIFIEDKTIVNFDSNNNFIAVGGGETNIIFNYNLSEKETKQVIIPVKINRLATDILFKNNDNIAANYFVTSDKKFIINPMVSPSDATYDITYKTTTEGVKISGNTIIFNDSLNIVEAEIQAISNDGLLVKVFKVKYVNPKNTVFSINEGINNINLKMPKAINNQLINFIPLVNVNNANSIDFIYNNNVIDSLAVFDIGEYTCYLNVNEVEYATLNLNVTRDVEKIENISFETEIDGSFHPVQCLDSKIYTSAKNLLVKYDLYPNHTSLSKVNIEVFPNEAIVVDNKITFSKPGNYIIKLSANNIISEFNVETTYGQPDANSKFKDSIVINKGENISFNDLLLNISPLYAESTYVSYESQNINVLKTDTNKFVGCCGGSTKIKILIHTVNGIINKYIDVLVNEAPTSIKLNKNYFIVNGFEYTINDSDFNILPITANVNKDFIVTSDMPNLRIVNNTIHVESEGEYKFTIKLSNDIYKEMYIIFVNKSKVVSLDPLIIPELQKGDEFYANIPSNISINYNGISNLNGLSYRNGKFIVESVVANPDDEYSCSFNIGLNLFKIKGIIEQTDITINFDNLNDVDNTSNGYVTGLKELKINAKPKNDEATYKDVIYTSLNEDVANCNNGYIIFLKPGIVTIRVSSKNNVNIYKDLTIRSTFGIVERVTLTNSNLMIDLDIDTHYDFTNEIFVYPTQLNALETCKLVSNNKNISINNLIVSGINAGSSIIKVQCLDINGIYRDLNTINVNLLKSAKEITLDSEPLLSNKTINIDTGTYLFKTGYLPNDANRNNNITIDLISGMNDAYLEGNLLLFLSANKPIVVKLSMGNISYDVTLISNNIVQIIDITTPTVVLPLENEIILNNKGLDYTIQEGILSTIDISNNQYKAINTGKFEIVVDGIKKDMIITKNLNKFGEIKIVDYDNSLNKYNDIILDDDNKALVTASKQLEFLAGDLDIAYNFDGSLAKYNFVISDNNIANIVDNKIIFKKTGSVDFIVQIVGCDYYGSYIREKVFNVTSTFGMATEFTFNLPTRIVDKTSLDIEPYINIIEPKFGADSIIFDITTNDCFKGDLYNLTIVKSGLGNIQISSTDGTNSKLESKDIIIDKNIDAIKIIENNNLIKNKHINSFTYNINPVLLSNDSLEPTIRDLKYEIVSGTGTINSSGVFVADKDYTKNIVRISSTANNNVYYDLLIVKVPKDINIIDINKNNKFVLNNIEKYVFVNELNEYNKNIINDDNISIINNDYAVLKFLNGGLYNYIISGKTIEITVKQNVDNIITNKTSYLTSNSSVNLESIFNISIEPSTAYDQFGPIKLKYSIISGNEFASLSNNVLNFNKQGAVSIQLTAGMQTKEITVESTMGYVKSAKWNKDNIIKYYSDGVFEITPDLFSVLPADVDLNKCTIISNNLDLVEITRFSILPLKGGIGKLGLKFETNSGIFDIVQTDLVIHNPINKIMTYAKSLDSTKNIEINKMLVQGHLYKINTKFDIDSSLASSYSLTYSSNNTNIATVDDNGLVNFKSYNQNCVITINLVNSDNSFIETKINLSATSDNIIYVDETYISKQPNVIEFSDNYIIYVIPSNLNDHISYSTNNDILTINNNGVVVINKAGQSNILVETSGSDNSYNKELLLNIHRITTHVSYDNSISNVMYTSKTSFNINPKYDTADSDYMKTLNYTIDGDSAVIKDNKLIFNKAGKVTVTIDVMYNDLIECTNSFVIESSYGKITSFEIFDSNNKIENSYVFDDKGKQIQFRICNILPSDAVLDNKIVINNSLDNTLSYDINNNNILFTSFNKGIGHVDIIIDDVTRTFNYESKLKVSKIVVKNNDIEISNDASFITMENQLILSVSVLPLNVNDPTLKYTISNGGSYDANSNILSLPNLGKYDVKITSNDNNALILFNVTKIDKLNEFTLEHNNHKTSSTEQKMLVNVAAGETNVILKFTDLPVGFLGNVDPKALTINIPTECSYEIKNNEISIRIPVFTNEKPTYNGTVSITMGTKSLTVNIVRDGIKVINFINHDKNEDLTTQYGLQQIRVFGKNSAYGNQNYNYYRMPISIEPANANMNLLWSTSDNRVSVTNDKNFAYVSFGSFVGNSLDDVKNDIFDKTVTVIATDASGTVKQEYTFHVVNEGVNVSDKEGFIRNSEIVLHASFGHEEDRISSKPFVLYDHPNPSNKSLIYGNGFTINYWAYSDQFKPTAKNKNTGAGVGNAFNVVLKGGSFSPNKETYHNCFNGYTFHYCYIQQSYKGIWGSDNQSIKNCYFRYLKDMSIQIANEVKNVYIENIISIDGGNVALECQVNNFNLKGFIDVYNFKNKAALKDLTAGIGSIANNLINDLKNIDNGKYCYIDENGDAFVNAVLWSGKGGAKADRVVKFWDGTNYVNSKIGNSYTAKDMVSKEVNLIIEKDLLYTYPVHDKDGAYMTYAHQHDNTYLTRQESKLKRLNQ